MADLTRADARSRGLKRLGIGIALLVLAVVIYVWLRSSLGVAEDTGWLGGVTALIVAIAGLVTAVTGLVQALKGKTPAPDTPADQA